MLKEFYPLGSVVRLKNGTKRIMICGRLQLRESDQKIFDYCACYYPEGIFEPKDLFFFQHKDIDVVYFLGYQDKEEEMIQRFIQTRNEELGR